MKPAITIFLLFSFTRVVAQSSFVFVRNAPANSPSATSVEIKWFYNDVINPDGFNLYRRQQGHSQWVLLNNTPIKKATAIQPPLPNEDADLEFFVDAVNRSSPAELHENFFLFNLVLKAFQSNAFARFLGIYFADSTAASGASYQYKVTRLTATGETDLGISATHRAGIYSRQAPIAGVEVFQDNKHLAINWRQEQERFYAVNIYSEDASGTVIKLNDKPLMLSMVADSSGRMVYPKPMYKSAALKEGEAYSLFLEGVDYFGDVTERSEPVALQFADVTPPAPPVDIRGKVDSLRVKLNWAQGDARDVMGYNVYRASRSEGPFVKSNKSQLFAADSVFAETLPAPGPNYYYVEAFDSEGNSARSEAIFLDAQDVMPPAIPAGLTIASDTGRFVLNWQASTEPDLKGYYVFRAIDSRQGGEFLLLNADPLDTNYYEQVLPENVRNKFLYYIVAIDSSYNRSGRSAVVSAAMPDATPPEKPFIKQVTYSDEGVVIEWLANVEADLAGYHIFRADSTSGPRFEKINVNLIDKSSYRYTDRNAEGNSPYLYAIVATDTSGNTSDYAAPAFALLQEDESANGQLTVRIRVRKRDGTVQLSWSELPPEQLRGYIVYRGTAENLLRPLSGLTSSAVFTDREIRKEFYVYQVRAYTQAGQVIYSPKIEWRSR